MKFRCSEYPDVGSEYNEGDEIEADDAEEAAEKYAEKCWENDSADGPSSDVYVRDVMGTETHFLIIADFEPTFTARKFR